MPRNLLAKRTKSYRKSHVASHEDKVAALQEFLNTYETFASDNQLCFVCGEAMTKERRRNGWWSRMLQTHPKFLVRQAFGKSGTKKFIVASEKSPSFAIALDGDETVSVPTCSPGCQALADLLYKENRQWMKEQLSVLNEAKERLQEVRKHLASLDRSHSQKVE